MRLSRKLVISMPLHTGVIFLQTVKKIIKLALMGTYGAQCICPLGMGRNRSYSKAENRDARFLAFFKDTLIAYYEALLYNKI